MKQLLTIILALFMMIISGCYSENHLNESSVSETAVIIETESETTDTSQNEISTADENSPTNEERSVEKTKETETVSSETNSAEMEGTTEKIKEESKPTASNFADTTVTESTETATESNETQTTENNSSETVTVTEVKATAADAEAVAAKMVEYINAYRTEEGVPTATVLPGLTKYAEYRSRQLVTNFAHDTLDERAAATALRYGQYIDPILYGLTGEPYYTANAREAIAKTDYGGTIDNVAKRLSRLARNSSSHWSYVGSADYVYIAIGITYESGIWYCDIAVSSVDTDN